MTKAPRILGIGHYVPEKVLTNADLEKFVDTSDEWITSRTGIKERRVAAEGEAVSDMALVASRRALESAGMTADDLTHIILCTLTPDFFCPPAACILEEKLGVRGKAAFDLNAACSGFVNGIETGRAFLSLHEDAKVLVVAAESLTSRTNWKDRTTCVLFGDGAGAVILGNAPLEGAKHDAAIQDVELKSDGAFGHLLTVGGGSAAPAKLGEIVDERHFIQMNGPEVFKVAVRSMESVCREVLERNSLTADDIDFFIPHQANYRILDAVARKLGLPAEKVCVTVDRYGNSSASSIIIALSEAVHDGRIKPGCRVLLGVFGGGFTWGSAILQF
ncbi:beta-ketoacyl-ACP synthase III [Desulfovibrio inopinatus]|uniref:beta-ketoacyl-ACP synthase III n=1 Tax=Desulfovibrio inopinatus TaxID=102109 RepID=UPI0004266ADA|nr:beta-ketoacyl-ACP synthase III [Desulfovibrio inopinatus]